MLDYLIERATVFDGLSDDPRDISVGIRGDRIVYLGREQPAAIETIDASGLYLCPGFIDTHASTGLGYRFPNAGDNKLFQGITTEIIGNCGTSTAPVGPLLVPTMERLADEIGFAFDWISMREWIEGVKAYGLPFNVGTFVGHSTLRAGTCTDAQHVTQQEIDVMCGMLDEAMADGALGMSTGLVYAPGSFATTQEIIDLAKVVARHRGIYVSHIRNERQELEASIDEAIRIGQEAGVPVLVSHLKAGERPNWGKIPGVIEQIERARAAGVNITFEVYPYAATSTKLRTFIPKAIMQEGVAGMVNRLQTSEWRQRSVDWLEENDTLFDRMMMITESVPGASGVSIQALAEHQGKEPAEMAIDILLADPDAWIIYHCIDEDDMDAAILWPDSIICSDSWSYPVNAPKQIGQPHPRSYGAFTRFLERYALKESRIPFGHAIKKISSMPADLLGLSDRGRIQLDCKADLVLLSPNQVAEKATYLKPRQFSEGSQSVWVNGVLMLRSGSINDKSPGVVLEKVQ